MAKPRLSWVVFAAMLVPWLVMNLRTAPRIEELAGGARLLEMRLTGYSFDEARGFVAAIGEEGARLYLDVQLWLDMAFPLLLGVVLFLGYRWLFPGLPGRIIGTISLGSIVVDYLENAAVAAMLRAGADGMTPQMAATANFWTTTKWGLAFVGAVTLLVGIALRLRRR
ncbi:MAG: hypothetical protein ACE360_05440 [Hyphomicrobiales bacterium]